MKVQVTVAVPVRIPQDIAAELAKLGDLLDVASEIKDLGGSSYKLAAYILPANRPEWSIRSRIRD